MPAMQHRSAEQMCGEHQELDALLDKEHERLYIFRKGSNEFDIQRPAPDGQADNNQG